MYEFDEVQKASLFSAYIAQRDLNTQANFSFEQFSSDICPVLGEALLASYTQIATQLNLPLSVVHIGAQHMLMAASQNKEHQYYNIQTAKEVKRVLDQLQRSPARQLFYPALNCSVATHYIKFRQGVTWLIDNDPNKETYKVLDSILIARRMKSDYRGAASGLMLSLKNTAQIGLGKQQAINLAVEAAKPIQWKAKVEEWAELAEPGQSYILSQVRISEDDREYLEGYFKGIGGFHIEYEGLDTKITCI